MFGWRRRIGYITPTVMEVVPYEFYRFAPEGVGLVGVSCNIDDWTPEEFERGLAKVSDAARYLGSRSVDFVVHGGGPLVVGRGPAFEEAIVKELENASGVSATTGVRSAIFSLKHVGARQAAIASPYPPRHNEALAAYLRLRGIEVCHAAGMDVPFKDMQNVPPNEIYRFARQALAAAPTADALYLPCPQWQAAQIVEVLEREAQKPVLAYTHANFFVAFQALNVRDKIEGHGMLLRSLAHRQGTNEGGEPW